MMAKLTRSRSCPGEACGTSASRRQVRTFEQCRHPAVVPFVDAGTAGGIHYLVWPLVEGQTFENLVEEGGKLPPAMAALCAMHVAEGLNICHQQGIIHGLVKPSNLMMGTDGQVRILDFGIGTLLATPEAESLVDTMSTANTLTSGLDCASPESILEPSDRTPAGDQYSLGCVLYFCLTGRYPFADSNAVEKMMAHQTKQPPPIGELASDAPEELIEVVDRLMQKNPGNRYPDFAHLIDALQPWAGTSVPAARLPKLSQLHRSHGSERDAARAQASNDRVSCKEAATTTQREAATASSTQPSTSAVTQEETASGFEERPSLEDRLGPFGLFLSAAVAASVTWLLTFWMFR